MSIVNLACANFAFPLLPFDAALDLIAALQFDGIDLGLFAGSSHVDPEETLGNVRSSAAALSARLRDRNLVVADLFVVPGAGFEALAPNHPDAAERARSRGRRISTLVAPVRDVCRVPPGRTQSISGG